MEYLQINSKVYTVTIEGVHEYTVVGISSSLPQNDIVDYRMYDGEQHRGFNNYNIGKSIFTTKEEALANYEQRENEFRKELLYLQREEYCDLKNYLPSRMQYSTDECVAFIDAKLTKIKEELDTIRTAEESNKLSLKTPIDDLGLSNRARNVLVCKCKLTTLGSLLDIPKAKLASTKGVGIKSFSEIIAKIKSLGYDY